MNKVDGVRNNVERFAFLFTSFQFFASFGAYVKHNLANT
jgi:hypothetical protein